MNTLLERANRDEPSHWDGAQLLRAIWFVVVPLLLTAITLRYLLLSPVRTPDGALRDFATWADSHQAPLAVALFLSFSWLVRYWRRYLPAARTWAETAAVPAATGLSTALWTGLLLVAVAAALFLRGSLFQSYRVLSGSMLPTLQPGELVLSKQYAYGLRKPWGAANPGNRAPNRGDVVVFHHPPVRPDVPEELVKRVIGLPGDAIVTRAGYAFINGWRIPTCNVAPYVFIAGEGMLEAQLRMEYLEDRVYLTAHGPWQPQEGDEAREPYVVQPGEVFVLGDNRNNSSDSRAWNNGRGGGLRFEDIGGRVDQMLLGVHRDGHWDTSRLFRPLGLEVSTEGIDDRDIRAGIEHCLKQRPKDTRPPPPEKGAKL